MAFRASCLSAHRRRLFQIFAFDCINYFMDERRIERSLAPKKKSLIGLENHDDK